MSITPFEQGHNDNDVDVDNDEKSKDSNDGDDCGDDGNDTDNKDNTRVVIRKDIVCAIITRNEGNQIFLLIGRRAGTLFLEGHYEFPGGKVSRVYAKRHIFITFYSINHRPFLLR